MCNCMKVMISMQENDSLLIIHSLADNIIPTIFNSQIETVIRQPTSLSQAEAIFIFITLNYLDHK